MTRPTAPVGCRAHLHAGTTPRDDPAAARLAWPRTVAFFTQHLRA